MRFAPLLATAFALAGLSGCAYRLGPTSGIPAATRSIQVQPFQNKTIEPRLVEAVSFALRRQLQQDGSFRLDTHNEGDIVVTGDIIRFERQSLSFQSRDALTPRDYRLRITAHVTARERLTGKVLLDREVTGYSDIRIGPDLASSERQAVPLVAADLARNTTALLVDGSW
jgi:outer membrane lipopolysaccharide assembly protein LptE/RlpB